MRHAVDEGRQERLARGVLIYNSEFGGGTFHSAIFPISAKSGQIRTWAKFGRDPNLDLEPNSDPAGRDVTGPARVCTALEVNTSCNILCTLKLDVSIFKDALFVTEVMNSTGVFEIIATSE